MQKVNKLLILKTNVMEQFKRAKVVMLPTNEKAKFGDLILTPTYPQKLLIFEHQNCTEVSQHLYFTSNDEIKEGDWFLNTTTNTIHKCCGVSLNIQSGLNGGEYHGKFECKKIIATTDSSLWEHDDTVPYPKTRPALPQPSQSFIEKYVEEYNKGNIITDVLVEYNCGDMNCSLYGCQKHLGCNHSNIQTVKINPKDNTITIKKVKDSWNREEHINNLLKYKSDLLVELMKCKEQNKSLKKEFTDKWIEENL